MDKVEDLLPLHYKKSLTQCQALAMAHLHFDPLISAPQVHTLLKFMYRYLIITTSLAEEKEGNTRNDFVKDHLQPAVATAIATKRRLGQRRSWRLQSCINYQEVRLSVECVCDEAWGLLSGSTCLIYLIQGYFFLGSPRVSVFMYSSVTSMNSLKKLSHQVDSELNALALGTKETQKAIKSLKDIWMLK